LYRDLQEIRSREEEMTKMAEEQKAHEDELKKREEDLAQREIEIFERELNFMIQEQGTTNIYWFSLLERQCSDWLNLNRRAVAYPSLEFWLVNYKACTSMAKSNRYCIHVNSLISIDCISNPIYTLPHLHPDQFHNSIGVIASTP